MTRNVTWNLPDVPRAYASWQRALKKGGVLLNMDSNYGPMDFTAAAKLTKNAHHGVAESLIETCQELEGLHPYQHPQPAGLGCGTTAASGLFFRHMGRGYTPSCAPVQRMGLRPAASFLHQGGEIEGGR